MGVVRLHISQLSIMEYITHTEFEIRSACEVAATALRKLQKLFPHAPDALQQCRQACTSSASEAIQSARDNLQEWIADLDICVEPIGSDHTEAVFTAYFLGTPPFKKLKHRADIPDAFIWQSVLECCKSGKPIIFVSGDTGFIPAVSSGPANLNRYATLKEVVETGPFAETLREGLLESQIDLASQLLPQIAEARHNFKDLLAAELIGRRIFFFFPVETDYEIKVVSQVRGVMSEGRAQYYGDGLLSFPFSARVACELRAVISRERAAAITQLREIVAAEPADDSTEVTLTRTLVLQGSLLTEIDKEVLGSHVPPEKMLEQILAGESAIDGLVVHYEAGRSGRLSPGIFDSHALAEARDQIDAGDLEVELDPNEEQDRIARARWFPAPKHLQDIHGKYHITEDTQFHIAPLPRFENWVRIFKKNLLVLLCHKIILSRDDHTTDSAEGKPQESAPGAISESQWRQGCGAQVAGDPRGRKSLGTRGGRRKARAAGGESRARSAARNA